MSLHTCRIDVNRPLSVYKDENSVPNQGPDRMNKENNRSWRTLGTQADRNKENNMIPSKWTSHKVFSLKPLCFFYVVHVRFIPKTATDQFPCDNIAIFVQVPQKLGVRAAVQSTRANSIEVFVDDECAAQYVIQHPNDKYPEGLFRVGDYRTT